MAGFAETWESLPFVTRHVGIPAITLYVLFALQLPQSAYFWRLPNAPLWEVWRYLTAPLSYTGSALDGFITVVMFLMDLSTLETTVFKKRSEMSYYLLWLAAAINVVAPLAGLWFAYLPAMGAAIGWTLAQEHPLASAKLLGVLEVPRRYMPLLRVATGVLLTGSLRAGLEPLLAIVVAHSFLFFTELVPRAGGTKRLARPPRPLVRLDEMEEEAKYAKRYGAGRRLAN